MAVKSTFKNMTICLLAICLVCSGLLAGVYALTKEPIDAAAKAKNEAAIKEVLPETAVAIEEERTVEYNGGTYTYNLAYDEKGEVVGCAINVIPVGFGGPIIIKVGFNKEGIIWNTKVLSQAETPGLGAKCVEPAFSEQFKGWDPYDGLNSKVFQALPFLKNSALCRLVVIQGFKRSPINFRKIAMHILYTIPKLCLMIS